MNTDISTPVGKPARKRNLSSPTDQSDLKKSKVLVSEPDVIVEEMSEPTEMTEASEATDPLKEVLCDADIKKITDAMETLFDKKLDDLISRVVLKVTEKMAGQMEALKVENARLKDRVERLEIAADSAEQYSRRNCLRISGIAEVENESTDDIVLEMADQLGQM